MPNWIWTVELEDSDEKWHIHLKLNKWDLITLKDAYNLLESDGYHWPYTFEPDCARPGNQTFLKPVETSVTPNTENHPLHVTGKLENQCHLHELVEKCIVKEINDYFYSMEAFDILGHPE